LIFLDFNDDSLDGTGPPEPIPLPVAPPEKSSVAIILGAKPSFQVRFFLIKVIVHLSL